MWKSFKVYISDLGYWGLIVIAPIVLNIIGIYQLATGNQFTWVPSWVWFLIAFISLLIIPFIAFHRMRIKRDEIQSELDSIKNLRAEIQVEAKVIDNHAFLEVHNQWVDANFTAEAIVVKGVPSHARYIMCWDALPHLEHPIKKGGTSTIIVAEKAPVVIEAAGAVKDGLLLYQCGISGVEKVGATTQELSERVKLNQLYPTMPTPVDDSCTIEITITSTPHLLNPFDNHKYVVKIDHKQGHKLLFTPLPESNLDKEGSLSK